jgi:hypothetical protein
MTSRRRALSALAVIATVAASGSAVLAGKGRGSRVGESTSASAPARSMPRQ